MLQGSFYTIINADYQENTIAVGLQLNNEHEIFQGHFPGQPVVPGACMLQMVKEILGDALRASLRLKKADVLKFIAPVDPRVTSDLLMKLTYKPLDNGWQITANLVANEVVCFKMHGVFVKNSDVQL